MINVGDKAPEILGTNEKGEEIRLSAYQGKKIVLYFYPKDSTSGCTAQACSLRDNYSELRKAGYEVIGVSVDNEKSHQKFIEKNNLPFTLIADTDKKLVEEFGVWGEKKLYGRKASHVMKTDIRELANGYEVVVDLPGFTKDEVQATLENGYLTISAEKGLDKDEKEKESGRYIRKERYAGACSRSFYVGEDITEEDIKAEFQQTVFKFSLDILFGNIIANIEASLAASASLSSNPPSLPTNNAKLFFSCVLSSENLIPPSS